MANMETPNAPGIDGEPLFGDPLLAATQCQNHSHRTGLLEHTRTRKKKMLCEAWLYIGTDLISSAKKKGGSFWKRIGLYFHEHRKFKPENFESDRNNTPLQKRWSFIQSECNRFYGAIEHVIMLKLSGHGVGELVSDEG
jgi:hypothetical protein